MQKNLGGGDDSLRPPLATHLGSAVHRNRIVIEIRPIVLCPLPVSQEYL